MKLQSIIAAVFCFLLCADAGAQSGFLPGELENPGINSINRAPARAFSMPLADVDAALSDELEPYTPYVKSLNGIWKISWTGDPSSRPDGFWEPGFDDSRWETIDVPSCAEMRGFGTPGYTNSTYPFFKDPPFIRDYTTGRPDFNPVLSYRTEFSIPENWSGREIAIRFDGVYSASASSMSFS